jgi:hypothetical protein
MNHAPLGLRLVGGLSFGRAVCSKQEGSSLAGFPARMALSEVIPQALA